MFGNCFHSQKFLMEIEDMKVSVDEKSGHEM